MISSIRNEQCCVSISDDGLDVTVEDRRRGVEWHVDAATWGYCLAAPADSPCSRELTQPLEPFEAGTVSRIGSNSLRAEYPVPGGRAAYVWRMLGDGLEVRLAVQSESVRRISLPGSFRPGAHRLEMLIPRKQGLLVRDVGPERKITAVRPGWMGLAMLAYLAPQASLIVGIEDSRDWSALEGRNASGLYGLFEVEPCAVSGWYERTVRIHLADCSITSVAKRYRKRLIERGDFVGWPEKIARKPILSQCFGALVAFLGYNKAHRTDYVAGARRLREFGFERVFYYPVRMNVATTGWLMGGDEPIYLSDEEIEAMRETGGFVAPWTWTYEALASGGEAVAGTFARDARGEHVPHWRIDDFVWYRVCTPYQIDFVRRAYEGAMNGMDWNHYDVNAVRGGEPCFDRDHDKHAGRPMSAREDQAAIARLLSSEVNDNRLVSSEGFVEACTKVYDMGSNKYDAAWGDLPFIPVPLSMLVFHDSTIHHWWELHTYNQTPFGFAGGDGDGADSAAGRPEKKAAMDALYGCPPLVFPFGRQYGWSDFATRRSFSDEIDIGSPEVQRALRAALPVTRLHRKIGRCEMLSFDFVTDDFAVQTSQFDDGTRIVANISDQEKQTDDFGALAPNTWKQV